MMMCTTESIPGRATNEVLGLVYGTTVRGAHVGSDVNAKLKNVVGGEIEEYTKLMAEAREQALDRMIRHAKEKGADAIIMVRFTTNEICQGAAECMAYGTAVKLAR
jgi:uncharacterized protein YbjQ (UPF0145 family)